ncbi:MAG: hypothetical protein ACSHYC_18290 [Alphaproteobacteria bacterium]
MDIQNLSAVGSGIQRRCSAKRKATPPLKYQSKVDRPNNQESHSPDIRVQFIFDKLMYTHINNGQVEGIHVLSYKIKVWGAFDLQLSCGSSIRPTVRKSCALLAMLALSDGHRQSRKWLQSQLWSSSNDAQGASSLRQELTRLKRLIGAAICSDRIDVWLDATQFEFDHLTTTPRLTHADLLQGMDIADEAFEDWLREQRQFFYNNSDMLDKANLQIDPLPQEFVLGRQPRRNQQPCTVIFDCDAKGSLEANVASMFFSEQLYRKLEQFDLFTCVGHDNTAQDEIPSSVQVSMFAVVVRIVAFANRDEVCLGVQVDSCKFGPRLGYQSIVLPLSMSQMRDAPEIGRLVQTTTDTLFDCMDFENLPVGSAAEAALLANQARKLTFALDRDSLTQADLLLTRAYEIEPRGQYLGWRAFLRNTAFFQHRTSNFFQQQFSSEELSLEALHQSPDDAIVQAFSSQLDYVNQGNLVEPLIRAERAAETDRSDPLARALLSNALSVNGHLEAAYQVALQSVSLASNSRYAFYFQHFACMAATAAGEYEVALRHARISVSRVPDFVSPRRYEVALALHLKDHNGVETAVNAMRQTEPDFNVTTMLEPTYPVNTLRRLPIIEAIR